jgi:hypothetical protein
MPETPLWDELTRSEQRLLIRLFGGGSLRNQNPADVESLCRRGLVDDEQKLSVPGLLALTLAMRRQKADALRRASAAANRLCYPLVPLQPEPAALAPRLVRGCAIKYSHKHPRSRSLHPWRLNLGRSVSRHDYPRRICRQDVYRLRSTGKRRLDAE